MVDTILDYDHGLHANVPPSVYHTRHLGLVSKGALDYVARSPLHYKAWVDRTLADEESPALAFGAAFHCALLEPERFATDYATEPDFGDCRKKDNKAARDAWRAEHAKATPIPPSEQAAIAGMIAAVRAHPLASRMMRDGEPELTVRWQDIDTGLQCKSRADYYVRKHGMIADVKSALDARPEAFRRSVSTYGYHVQDAIYRAGFAAVDAPVAHFVFIVVEKTPPHAIAVYSLDAVTVARGYAAFRARADTLAECLRTNEWPGYPGSIQELSLPAWAV